MALEETNEDRLRNEIAQLESDGERMTARIAALESQLAPEASAVETMGKVEAMLCDKTTQATFFVDSHQGCLVRVMPCFGNEVARGHGKTLLSALAALVQNEGKEDGDGKPL